MGNFDLPVNQPVAASRFVKPGILLIAALLFLAGFLLLNTGFSKIKSVWELQRFPTTPLTALLPGEVMVTGHIASQPVSTDDTFLTSKLSQQQVVYFRYLHQKRVGSGDDERWQTIEDLRQAADFYVTDGKDSVRVTIGADMDRVNWSMPVTSARQEGDHHYREWVLQPGDQVTVLGWYQRAHNQAEISFRQLQPYRPFISQYGAGHETQQLGHSGIFVLWGGLAVLGLAVYALCYVLAIHRILGYLTILSLVYSITLTVLGLHIYQQNLQELQTRWERQVAGVDAEMAALAKRHQLSWDGLDNAGAINQLNSHPEVNQRVQALQQSLATSLQLARYQIGQWPASLLARLWNVDLQMPAALASLPPDLAKTGPAEARLAVPLWQWVVIVVSVVLAVILSVAGLRAVKSKRWLENIPASKAQGVVLGVNELTGKVTALAEMVTAPLSQQPCIWYNYRVFKRSGGNSRNGWKLIEQRSNGSLFLLTDDSGSVLVDPSHAEVSTTHRQQQRNGDVRIVESCVREQDHLFLIGVAQLSDREDYLLKISKGQADEPFMLSNRSEAEVMLKQGRKGMLLLNLASSALILSCLLLFTRTGNYSGIDFLATALLATGYLFLLMLVLHYNDLIFLKHRVERALANIDVALQKRFDLLNNLLPVVRRYAVHEQSLLSTLTKLRGLPAAQPESPAPGSGSPPGSDKHRLSALLAATKQADTQLRAVAENYPELQQHELIQQFMASLTHLEDETTLLRDGYNDAVEVYQSRLQSFPDLLIARLFQFRKADFGRMQ